MDTLTTDKIMQAYNTYGELITFKFRKSKSKFIGNTYITYLREKYKVLGNLDIKNKYNQYNWFLIEFEDKTQVVVHGTVICHKNIKNPNTPLLYGVGFMGQGKYNSTINGKVTKEYKLWQEMLQRCYNPKYQETRLNYKGYTVDSRWHNFQNFCEDIQHLEGYTEWKNNNNISKYKYVFCKNKGNKIYSKDACLFTTNIRITGKT